MHTPRFSGQPTNAGDFVLLITASRPMRTSCENVGTVVLFLCGHTAAALSAQNFEALARRAHKNARERTKVLKGLLRIRRNNQQETPYALQEAELFSWSRLGEAYSALRGWRPIPAALLSHSVLQCSGTEDISLPTNEPNPTWLALSGKTSPDKQRSIRKKTCSVKSLETRQWKTVEKPQFGLSHACGGGFPQFVAS